MVPKAVHTLGYRMTVKSRQIALSERLYIMQVGIRPLSFRHFGACCG